MLRNICATSILFASILSVACASAPGDDEEAAVVPSGSGASASLELVERALVRGSAWVGGEHVTFEVRDANGERLSTVRGTHDVVYAETRMKLDDFLLTSPNIVVPP